MDPSPGDMGIAGVPFFQLQAGTTKWVVKPMDGPSGTVVVLIVSWKYSNRYQHNQYYRVRKGSHEVTYAPVYDGVAGGSPDDVITKVGPPYLTFDLGVKG